MCVTQWCETMFSGMAKLARVIRSGSMMARELRIDHHLAMSSLSTLQSLPHQLLRTMEQCADKLVKLEEELDALITSTRTLLPDTAEDRGVAIIVMLLEIQGV